MQIWKEVRDVKLEERKEYLIHFLLDQPSYITVARAADELRISGKTVYRMIKELNGKSGSEQLIQTEKGKGIKLDYDIYLESRFNVSSKHESICYNYSPVERRMHIIKELLFRSPGLIREDQLFGRYYLSPSAVYMDKEIIGEQLGKEGLLLKKHGNRLSVIGPENVIRKMLIQILMKMGFLNVDDLSSIDVPFNKTDMSFVVRQIELMEKMIGSVIPAPYNVNLLTHLYILICRAGKGIFDDVTPDATIISRMSKDNYYSLAVTVTKNIEHYLNKPLPENETVNIFNYLAGSRMGGDKVPGISAIAPKVRDITNFFITKFEQMAGIRMQPSLIFCELASHIKPMLNRLRSNIAVKNVLIDDIRKEYGEFFQMLRKIADEAQACYELQFIDDDEVGFITLYFARYMEQNPCKIRTLILCTTGMGTSELLHAKVMKFFPEIDVLATAAIKKVSKEYLKENRIDLILTTVKLETDWMVPVVLVNTLFIEKDQDKVRNAIKEIVWKTPVKAAGNSSST